MKRRTATGLRGSEQSRPLLAGIRHQNGAISARILWRTLDVSPLVNCDSILTNTSRLKNGLEITCPIWVPLALPVFSRHLPVAAPSTHHRRITSACDHERSFR